LVTALVVSARPPDLSDRAKHLLDSANVGEPLGSPRDAPGRAGCGQRHGVRLCTGGQWI